MLSNNWKFQINYYGNTFQSKEYIPNYLSALKNNNYNTFEITGHTNTDFYNTFIADTPTQPPQNFYASIVLLEPASSTIITILRYITAYKGTIPYHGKYFAKLLLFKNDLSEVYFYDYNNNDVDQFYDFNSPLIPKVTKITKILANTTLEFYFSLCRQQTLPQNDYYTEELLTCSLFNRDFIICNEFGREIPFQIGSLSSTKYGNDYYVHDVTFKVPPGVKNYCLLKKQELRTNPNQTFIPFLDNTLVQYYDYELVDVYPTGNVVIDSYDPTLRIVVTSDKPAEGLYSNISCSKCYLIDEVQNKCYEADPLISYSNCFLTVEFSNLTAGNYRFLLVNCNYKPLFWEETINISLQQILGTKKDFKISQKDQIYSFFQNNISTFGINIESITLASIEQVIKVDMANRLPFTKDNLGGYKLFYESSQENKIIYVNHFFNLLDGYFETHFPIYDYKVLDNKADFRTDNKPEASDCIFFSGTASDYDFYQSKKYQILQITAKNKNAFCKTEEIKNLAFRAVLAVKEIKSAFGYSYLMTIC